VRILEDGDWANTAILYRTNAQSLPFETAFTRHRIPYRVVGALRFYEREEGERRPRPSRL
jgi:DNA helicase-2/ATP-dependent DNA helicase PcrA